MFKKLSEQERMKAHLAQCGGIDFDNPLELISCKVCEEYRSKLRLKEKKSTNLHPFTKGKILKGDCQR